MNEREWYSIELNQKEAKKFKEYLENAIIKFEIFGCFELIHFEIKLDSTEVYVVNKWMKENIYKDTIANQ